MSMKRSFTAAEMTEMTHSDADDDGKQDLKNDEEKKVPKE